MQNEELHSVKKFIGPAEQRIKDYKEMLTDVFRNSKKYLEQGTDPEFLDWYKDHLREMKNEEEKGLKYLIHCRKYEKEGLNPPGCYPKSQENPYGHQTK